MKLYTFTQMFAAGASDAVRRREEGQTMAEYGVVLAVMTLTVLAAISLLGVNVSNGIESIANLVPG